MSSYSRAELPFLSALEFAQRPFTACVGTSTKMGIEAFLERPVRMVYPKHRTPSVKMLVNSVAVVEELNLSARAFLATLKTPEGQSRQTLWLCCCRPGNG